MIDDMFRIRREVKLRPESDLWHLASIATASMRRAVERLDGHLVTKVSIIDVGGGEFRRDSLDAARRFLEDNDVSPRYVFYEDELQESIQNPRRVAHVLTVIGYERGVIPEEIQIVASGPNRLIVDGLVAEAERVLSKIESEDQPSAAAAMGPALETFEARKARYLSAASSGEAKASSTERHALIDPASQSGAKGAERRSVRSWLASTWREHRSAIIIGLSTTLVGGIFLAWLLG